MVDENILSKRQYGFISGRSTLLQLLTVLDRWTQGIDQGKETDVIFLDFQKAFDKVPHNRLLDKLSHYGITGTVLTWIKSFLLGRKQRVRLHEAVSPWEEVRSGIPQGSVLGPSLFIIFINSLPDAVTSSEIFLFADDAKIFRQIVAQQDQDDLQKDLNSLYDWTKNSLLQFNSEKCSTMTISRQPAEERKYYMNGNELKRTHTERDLGVIIDEKLTFEEHISSKIKKANSMIGLIRRTYTYLDDRTFLLLYKALVRPHLEYCNQIWHPYLQKHIAALENVQRRATRMIPGNKNLNYQERLTKLKLPSLAYRRMRGDLIEIYKITTGKYDNSVSNSLFTFNNRTSRNHRLKLKIHRPYTNLRKNSFTLRSITTWNKLPESIVLSESTKIFESKLDKYFQNQTGINAFEPPYAH